MMLPSVLSGLKIVKAIKLMLGAVTLSTASLNAVIDDSAMRNGVEPALIKAFIQAESNWDVNASRYEPHLKDSSWGLMQVLLKTAKWMLGDDTLTISKLVTPKVNIEAGTKYIKYQLTKYRGNTKDAIAAYNAGKVRKLQDGSYKNQKYVDKVYGLYLQYKTGKSVSAGFFGGNTILIAAASLVAGAVVFALAS